MKPKESRCCSRISWNEGFASMKELQIGNQHEVWILLFNNVYEQIWEKILCVTD